MIVVNYFRVGAERPSSGGSATFCSCYQLPRLRHPGKAQMLELLRQWRGNGKTNHAGSLAIVLFVVIL